MESVMSDSRSDSSEPSPTPTASFSTNHPLAWTNNFMMGGGGGSGSGTTSANANSDAGFQFSSMMYPITSQLSTSSATSPLQTTSSQNPFDFSATSSTQPYSFYQNSLTAAAAYSPWAYQAAYSFPYQGMYGAEASFKEATLSGTAGSSAASTPVSAAMLPWTISQEGKKKRQPYKKDQISRLEYEYSQNSYLTNKRRADLSSHLNLDEKQVKVWFQNRRMKDKKLRQRISGPFPHGAPVTPCLERLIN